jgi:hypothetical protein
METEDPITRRDRITALVKVAYPEKLDHNQLANAVLDIIRSAGMCVSKTEYPVMSQTDILEAIDAIAEMNL